MAEGVDYAFGWTPGLGAKLAAAGKTFVCRYLSGGNSKDITAAEIADLESANLAVVLVWETDGRTGPLSGAPGGTADATAACAQAKKLGIPNNTCIYFAVDFGATSSQLSILEAYFDAARSVCHANGYRSGDYGGLVAVSGTAAHADLTWQTYAWSGGAWSPAAAIQQYLNGQVCAGIQVDLDRTTTLDYGQFGGPMPTPAPPPPPTGPIWIARRVALAADGNGYKLDGWGGLHPVGSMPAPVGAPYWQGWNIARAVALAPDGSGGYVLDGWGGVHAFSARGTAPPAVNVGTAYWKNWDIATDIVVTDWKLGHGHTLDGWGGFHAWVGTPAESSPGYWPGGNA